MKVGTNSIGAGVSTSQARPPTSPTTTTRLSRTTGRALSVVRTIIGVYFIAQASAKLASGWLTDGANLVAFVGSMLPHSVGFYSAFLQAVVLPNSALFAQLATLGELLVGASLALGLFTRLGAGIAIWLTLNYALLKGLVVPGAILDVAFLAASLAFLRAPSALTWALDNRLHAWPRQPRP